MRRLVPLALAAGLLVSGCGTERPGADPEADPSFSSAPTPSTKPTPTSTPTPTATPPQATDLEGPLANFPLALGYDDENGDDHSPVVVTARPASRAFRECGRQVWDPTAGSSDVMGVEFRGEAEWFRGRTLVLYPSTEAASTAVVTARDVITHCPRDDGDDYGWTEHTLINYVAGHESVGWIDRWWTTEVNGFDTGLIVYHVARVGRAVLLTYEYGEGNGSEQTRRSALDRAAEADQPVVDAMGDLERADYEPVGDAFTLTPKGGAPFVLGMTVEEARRAADHVRIDDGTFCPQLSWTDRTGVHVHGAFSPGIGLAYLSIDGGGTTEGVAVGDTLDDLRAAYPNLAHADNGLWYIDQGDTGYAFEVNRSHTIDWILLTADDQHCAG